MIEKSNIIKALTTIWGVDFSGAIDAGRKIWISKGLLESGKLSIKECFPATELPNSGTDRDICLRALVDLIGGSRPAIFGIDFPFSIPAKLIRHETWEGFVLDFPGAYPNAEKFRKVCFEQAGKKEWKRKTDREAKTPFSPYNLKLYRQTYYGIGNLLYSVVASGLSYVLPMQQADADKPIMLEICPASTLKQQKLYTPYKGKGEARKATRLEILAELERKGVLELSSEHIRSSAAENTGGDALDSIVAAAAVFQTIMNPAFPDLGRDEPYLTEGYVYH